MTFLHPTIRTTHLPCEAPNPDQSASFPDIRHEKASPTKRPKNCVDSVTVRVALAASICVRVRGADSRTRLNGTHRISPVELPQLWNQLDGLQTDLTQVPSSNEVTPQRIKGTSVSFLVCCTTCFGFEQTARSNRITPRQDHQWALIRNAPKRVSGIASVENDMDLLDVREHFVV